MGELEGAGVEKAVSCGPGRCGKSGQGGTPEGGRSALGIPKFFYVFLSLSLQDKGRVQEL